MGTALLQIERRCGQELSFGSKTDPENAIHFRPTLHLVFERQSKNRGRPPKGVSPSDFGDSRKAPPRLTILRQSPIVSNLSGCGSLPLHTLDPRLNGKYGHLRNHETSGGDDRRSLPVSSRLFQGCLAVLPASLCPPATTYSPVECPISKTQRRSIVIEKEENCPHCGSRLVSTSGAKGQCLGCLVQLGLNSSTLTLPAAGSETSALSRATPKIQGFTILGPLGEGGMGTVYLAEEEDLGRRVALKVVSHSFESIQPTESRSRFLREARTMAQVEHPNIVRVYRLGRCDDDRDFLAMEYVEGETLAQRIDRLRVIHPTDALSLVRQTVEALDAAWNHGVVHRDIKPSNLFIDGQGRVRVGDFGLARPVEFSEEDKLTLDGSLLGTPTYIAPEQARGHSVDFRSDIYSLGIVLFEMLVGDPPFSSSNPFDLVLQHQQQDLPMARVNGRSVAPEILDLLQWMTAKDPRYRPAGYAELLATLHELLESPGTPVPSSSRPPATPDSIGSRSAGLLPLGPLVAKRCDRNQQMTAFVRHYREHRHDRRPLVYLLHGDEGECHGSLVQRFAYEHVSRALETDSLAPGGGVLLRRVTWPDGDSLAELQSYLVTDLFTDLDPGYCGVDTSAKTLASLDRLSLNSVVILEHEIRSSQLQREGLQLIEWYVNDFWNDVPRDPGMPQFLVILNLIHSRREPTSWPFWPARQAVRTRRLTRQLEAIFSLDSIEVPRVALNALEPVSLDHVKQWFSLNSVLENDKERYEAAERLFTNDRGTLVETLPMAEVELALSRIHTEFLKRKGLHL